MKILLLMLLIITFILGCASENRTSSNVKDESYQTEIIPSDFKIILSLSPGSYGEAGWRPWSLTVTGDGKAVQDITPSWKDKREEHTLKPFSIPKRVVKEIYTSLKDEAFFTRPTGVTEFCIDSAALVLEVTMDGNAYRYMIQDVSCGSVNDDIVRTLTGMLLKKIPSPNNNRELKIFEIESNALESTSIRNMAAPMRAKNRNPVADNKNNEDEIIDQPAGSDGKRKKIVPVDKLAIYREEYSDFIKTLNLPREKIEELLKLIRWVDKLYVPHSYEEILEFNFNADRELKDFLGAKDYAAFEEYNKFSSERYIVNGFVK